MPQEPKKRHSRARQGKRRASIHMDMKVGIHCTQCGAISRPHQVCKKCGYYKGREIVKKTKVTVRKVANG